MKIGIDIDGVVLNYMKGYLEFYNQEKNTNYKSEDIFSQDFGKSFNTSLEEARETVRLFRKTDIFKNLDLIEGAKEGILGLERNNDICFITARHESVKQTTRGVFGKIFPDKNFEIFFSGELWGSGKTKGEICLELGINIMVEDNVDYALDCAQNGVKVFLLDTPWNKDYTKHENLIKVKDWTELIKFLEEEIYAN